MQTQISIALVAGLLAFGCGGAASSGSGAATAGNSTASAGVTGSAGQVTTARAALERFFRTPKAQPDWFAPSFLTSIPIEKVQALLDQLRGQIGEFRSVSGAGEDYVAVFRDATVATHVTLDDQGRFIRLFLEPPQRI